jgi:uncharacterized protein YqiB (DUF1249 family)
MLMAVYESNYLRLAELAGELRALHGERRSIVAGDCDLVLTVTERAAYTTTVNLTYVFERDAAPDMTLRIYHDARLAEAQAWGGPHGHQALRTWRRGAERELDHRWARNVMLNKWLEYCVDRGHCLRYA